MENPNNKCILYADDVSALTSCKTVNEVLRSRKPLIESMTEWCTNNNLVLSTEKTQVSIFSHRNSLLYDDFDLGMVKNVKFLGIYVDSCLKWDSHIDFLCKKLNTVFYLMSVIKYTVSLNVLKMLYYGLFYSRISYGVMLWGSSPKLHNVFLIQKKLLRVMFKQHHRAHCRPLFKNQHLLTVPCIYIYHSVIYAKQHLSDFTQNNSIHS